jgi:hypothetical protein
MILNMVASMPSRTRVRKDKVCRCKKMHKHHICESRAKGNTHEINQLTQNPNAVCGICGEMADSEEDICLPVPLFI